MDYTRSAQARSGLAATAELAAQERRRADKLLARSAFDSVDNYWKAKEGAAAREDAERLLKPPKALIGNASTELVPSPHCSSPDSAARAVRKGPKVPTVRLRAPQSIRSSLGIAGVEGSS